MGHNAGNIETWRCIQMEHDAGTKRFGDVSKWGMMLEQRSIEMYPHSTWGIMLEQRDLEIFQNGA